MHYNCTISLAYKLSRTLLNCRGSLTYPTLWLEFISQLELVSTNLKGSHLSMSVTWHARTLCLVACFKGSLWRVFILPTSIVVLELWLTNIWIVYLETNYATPSNLLLFKGRRLTNYSDNRLGSMVQFLVIIILVFTWYFLFSGLSLGWRIPDCNGNDERWVL